MMKKLNLIFPLSGLVGLLGINPALNVCRADKAFTEFKDGDTPVASHQSSGSPLAELSPEGQSEPANKAKLLFATKNENTQRWPGGATPANTHPTYLRDVLPIFMGKCFRCHNGQTKFLNNWLNYKTTVADRWEIKRRIWDSWRGEYFKQPMPTINSPESIAFTEEERTIIKEWVDGGAAYGVPPKESNPRSKTERVELGRRLFTTICAACHQPTGQGLPGRFPPLAGSDFLNSNKERAIQVVLNGLQGEVVVNGFRFNNSMPQFPLSDGEIASALTYVYNSFGNSGKDVTPEEVKALRGRADLLNTVHASQNTGNHSLEKSPWE
jgi:mono/diheme cytochrome c family protein